MKKKLNTVEPYILCEKIKAQDKIGNIVIPGLDGKPTVIRKVVETSKAAENRNIKQGNIIVIRPGHYMELPVYLTDDDQVPYDSQEKLELVDPSQIVGVYKDEEVGE